MNEDSQKDLMTWKSIRWIKNFRSTHFLKNKWKNILVIRLTSAPYEKNCKKRQNSIIFEFLNVKAKKAEQLQGISGSPPPPQKKKTLCNTKHIIKMVFWILGE